MKPIIVDMKDMSDSAEVYNSRPNHFLVYTIYAIFAALLVGILWMCLFKIDIVVKGNGIFKGSSNLYGISSAVTGKIKENNVANGQYVNAGDVLYVVDIDSLPGTIMRYQEEAESAENRIAILTAYENSLDTLGEQESETDQLLSLSDNPYFEEFMNRRDLLVATISLSDENLDGQSRIYRGNVDSISGAIGQYNEKISRINSAKQCILSQNNTMDPTDSYYYSIVSSYLSSYTYTATQYDSKIAEYQQQIEAYDKQIKKGNEQNTWNLMVSGNDAVSGGVMVDVDSLSTQQQALVKAKESAIKEKEQALQNLETNQIAVLEQQISSYGDTILSMETSLNSAKLQLSAVGDQDSESKSRVAVLTEKGNIAAELLAYREKAEECENYLKNFDITSENCTVRASISGYYYAASELRSGTYVQEGMALGTIYPEEEAKYYADIYVDNSDIAKIREGQEVKFEIGAYPSSEYGYFTGVVDAIAKDITIDSVSGSAYYLVRVSCNQMEIKNADGEEASLMNGMACQAKVIVDEETVMPFLLKKMNLMD